VSAFTGKAALDFNDDKTIDEKDRYQSLTQQGIVGDIQVALKRGKGGAGGGGGGDSGPGGGMPQTVCLAGMQVLKKCVQANGTVRTFWNRKDAQ
jgi:hypothetical protein